PPPLPLARRAVSRRLAPRPRCGELARVELHARTPRLRQPDRDRLPRALGAVLALANVAHLLAHELACLRRRRFARALVPPRTLDGSLLRHVHLPAVTNCKIAAQILWRDDRAPTTLFAMRDDALSTTLEAALLRQLLATWRTLNDSYFKGRLQAPTLALID